MLYLGGQHRFLNFLPVTEFTDHLCTARSVNRTHAYAINGRALKTVYQWICSDAWLPNHHIDHHLEELHRSGSIFVFSTKKWIVSQAPGQSDITRKIEEKRTWDEVSVPSQGRNTIDGFSISGYRVGFGDLGFDDSFGYDGTSRFAWQPPLRRISIHAPSRIVVTTDRDFYLFGGMDGMLRSSDPVSLFVDAVPCGVLQNPGEKTRTFRLCPGRHEISFECEGGNKNAHTVLFVAPLEECS